MERLKDYISTAKQILKKNLASLILFEVSFRIFMTILLRQAGQWVLGQILRLQGYRYMTADNCERVLTHPASILTILAALLILLLLLLFECCGILACFERGWKKGKNYDAGDNTGWSDGRPARSSQPSFRVDHLYGRQRAFFVPESNSVGSIQS